MKKVITILLSLLMVVSLAACGGQSETVGQIEESSTTNEQVETTTLDAEETAESTEPAETEAPTEPEETAPAFDTSWASNEFEMLLPKPPFDDWTAKETSPSAYELNRNNSADWDDYSAWDEQGDIFYAYVNGLADYGFIVEEEIGPNWTQVDVYNASGDRFTFTDRGGAYEIRIHTVSPKVSMETTEPTEQMKKEKQVDLPDGDWVCEEENAESGYFKYSAKDVSEDVIEAYVDELKLSGYTMHNNESEGNRKYWSFINPETDGAMTIQYKIKSGRCIIYVDSDF